MISTDWIAKWAQYTPDAIAVKWEPTGEAFTYRQCDVIASRLVSRLRTDFDLKKGDRIAVVSQNSLAYVFLFFAVQRAGFILVPINHRLTVREMTELVRISGPRLFFYDEEFAPTVDTLMVAAPTVHKVSVDAGENHLMEMVKNDGHESSPDSVDIEPNHPCMILFTSGTTGLPKGAIITHGMLFWNSVNTALRLKITSDDVTFNVAPLFHTGGWNVLTTPFLHHGARIVFLRHFDADKVLHVCEAEKVTLMFGLPTMLKMMAGSGRFAQTDLSSMRYAIVGGEAMPVPLIENWHRKGVLIRQGFGMTEVGPNCFSLSETDAVRKIGSIGFPNFYVDVRLVDDAGHDVGVNEPGELWFRGPVVTPGYWNNPEATAEAFTGDWFHTGDILRRDEDGYYYVVDRKKNMFISGGENVYPAEVERLLYTMPGIAEVAVIGVPDPKWGEVGAAFVVRKPGVNLTEKDVMEWCNGKLARFKIPKSVTFLDELPKGDSGKILKRALLDIWSAHG